MFSQTDLALLVVMLAVVWVWHLLRHQLPQTITIDSARRSRAVVQDVMNDALYVLRAGVHTLPITHIVKEFVDTNVQLVPELGEKLGYLTEKARAGTQQVYFLIQYAYKVSYLRDPDVPNGEDAILDNSVQLAFGAYDKPEERFAAVQQILSNRIERAGRLFSPGNLSDAGRNPCYVLVTYTDRPHLSYRKIAGVEAAVGFQKGSHPNLRQPDLYQEWVLIDNTNKLMSFFAQFVVDSTNMQVNRFGMNVEEFNLHDLPYASEELQVRAEKEYGAEKIVEAVKKLMTINELSGEQAVLIALGQDADFDNLTIHKWWIELAKRLMDPNDPKSLLPALTDFLQQKFSGNASP